MKRHATDLVSLIFGLIFVLGAGWWLAVNYLDLTINWDLPHLGWFLAGGLIVLGLLGVAASLRRDQPPAAEPPTAVHTTPSPEPSFVAEPEGPADDGSSTSTTQEMDADRRG